MIYTSPIAPAPDFPELSLFDYFFPSTSPSSKTYLSPSILNDDRVAYIDGPTGATLTRGELQDRALRLATALRARGIGRGDTVLLVGVNSFAWVVAAWGCQAVGTIVSPANVAYSPHEIAHQFNDSGSCAVLVDEALLPGLEKARKHFKTPLPDSRIILLTPSPIPSPIPTPSPTAGQYNNIKTLIETYPRSDPEHFDGPACHATAWLCYSSGTTGLPKGVLTSHYNLISQMQIFPLAFPRLDPDVDSFLAFLPFSHMYALAASVHLALALGVKSVVYPRFDEVEVLKGIEKYRITFAKLVPPVILLLLHSAEAAKYDLSSIHTVLSAAAPMSQDLTRAFEKRFPHCVVIQAWGATETTPAVTLARRDAQGSRRDTVGQLLPSYQARLVDESGRDVGPGERGEVWVKARPICKGYHNNPEADRSTWQDGWFKTGDILVVDEDGWWTVVDRLKELIKYKGFQVPPAELEALLLNHPKVIDVGVIGVWSEEQVTELPRAYVVIRPDDPGLKTPQGRAALSQEVADWLAGQVANHKRLRGGVILLDAIPKSPSGKILRRQLRDLAASEVKAAMAAKAKL